MARSRAVKHVAISGIIGNIFLLVIKLWIGFVTRSQAMIADGMNSAGDVFASLMTYIGNHIASQPDDESHPYGHGKAEYLFSMLISLSLIGVALFVFRQSLDGLVNRHFFIYSHWLVVVAVVTIVLKAVLYIYANRTGKRFNSLLAYANAEDHRNDIFVTSLTLISIVTGYYKLYYIDAIAGMIIAIWIAYTGIQIFTSSYNVLMDTALSDHIMTEMRSTIRAVSGVDHLDSLVAKPVGLNYLLIVKVSIDGELTIFEGHSVAEMVREALQSYELVDDVVVHLNPTQHHPEENLLK